MDCSPSGSSVHGILQARVLEWVVTSSPGSLPDPGIESRSPTLQADALISEPLGKPPVQSLTHYPSTLTSLVSFLSPLLCAALHPALASLLTGVHAKRAFTAGSLPLFSLMLAILPYIHKHISFLHSCRFLLKSSRFIKISFQHTHIHSSPWLFFCHIAAAAAAKLLQLCPTLCDPIDSSPPGSAVPGILQARTLEWVAISFSNA